MRVVFLSILVVLAGCMASPNDEAGAPVGQDVSPSASGFGFEVLDSFQRAPNGAPGNTLVLHGIDAPDGLHVAVDDPWGRHIRYTKVDAAGARTELLAPAAPVQDLAFALGGGNPIFAYRDGNQAVHVLGRWGGEWSDVRLEPGLILGRPALASSETEAVLAFPVLGPDGPGIELVRVMEPPRLGDGGSLFVQAPAGPGLDIAVVHDLIAVAYAANGFEVAYLEGKWDALAGEMPRTLQPIGLDVLDGDMPIPRIAFDAEGRGLMAITYLPAVGGTRTEGARVQLAAGPDWSLHDSGIASIADGEAAGSAAGILFTAREDGPWLVHAWDGSSDARPMGQYGCRPALVAGTTQVLLLREDRGGFTVLRGNLGQPGGC